MFYLDLDSIFIDIFFFKRSHSLSVISYFVFSIKKKKTKIRGNLNFFSNINFSQ